MQSNPSHRKFVGVRPATTASADHREGRSDLGDDLIGPLLQVIPRDADHPPAGGDQAVVSLPIALARTLCAQKAMQIGLDGVQLLGGHGFTKEHPVERWYRDLRAIGIMEGTVLV